jgi:hypothetical protein
LVGRSAATLDGDKMLSVRLKKLHSPDLEVGLLPADPLNCRVLVQATIGPADLEGGDTFNFEVVTPNNLASLGARWGKGILILPAFSWTEIERFIGRLVANSSQDDWPSTAKALNQYLDWEFDGYPSSPSNNRWNGP